MRLLLLGTGARVGIRRGKTGPILKFARSTRVDIQIAYIAKIWGQVSYY